MDRWKFKVVCRHLKKGSRHLLDIYRPVRHLIDLGKRVELAVWDQMMSHCMQKRVLHPNQHGSLPSHIVTTAVAQVHDILTAVTEQKMMSAVVLLDQSAGFDLVDHGTLTAKMSTLNFSPGTVGWFKNYLVGRRFSCKLSTN